MDNPVLVKLWGMEVGVLLWDDRLQLADFQYTPEWINSGLELSPLMMPLREQPYRFPELQLDHQYSDTFCGLPGLVADSLPEKYGNQLLSSWLARQGRNFSDMTPLERLCYLGSRGMGALEYVPALNHSVADPVPVDVQELVDIASAILNERNQVENIDEQGLSRLISVGTSAGGAKAKAVIAWNGETGEVMSGQGQCPPGFSHWLLKFDDFENQEHATSKEIGRIEYAYHLMAVDAGIEMMESRLMSTDGKDHFMTRRFDRTDEGGKLHIQTYCAIAHADRNPPGLYSYESLFTTARQIKLNQKDLNQLYRRMVFNILTRNQDDHTKNHAFVMDGTGRWFLAPAYDICFSYKPGNRFIENHQMSCNRKRDGFILDDLLTAAKAADVKKPMDIIHEVISTMNLWQDYANAANLSEGRMQAIENTFRLYNV